MRSLVQLNIDIDVLSVPSIPRILCVGTVKNFDEGRKKIEVGKGTHVLKPEIESGGRKYL